MIGDESAHDDDRYDLDESNMFQTSFNDSNFGRQAPLVQVEEQQPESSNFDFINESQATCIQEDVPRLIHHENLTAESSLQQSINFSTDEKQSPRFEMVLDELAREEEEKSENLPAADVKPKSSMLALDELMRQQSLEEVDLESKLQIEVAGLRWHQDNVIYQGHYEFTVQSCRTGPSKLTFLTDRTVTEVERRYSDFDLFRQALCCEYPGFFIPVLPPKETFLAFKQEDSESLAQRKLGIMHFLEELAAHTSLSREENHTLSNFLTVRSAHQFSAYKTNLSNKLKGYSFIAEYANQHQLVEPSNAARQIKDYVAGAAFYVKKNLMGLGAPDNGGSQSGPFNGQQQKSNPTRAGSLNKVECATFGPFKEQMEAEKQEFALFENYLQTLHKLQHDIINELTQFQLVQSHQASNYERLSESFTMLKRMKGQKGENPKTEASVRQGSRQSITLSMQMDSIDRGSQTAQFGGVNNSNHSLSQDFDGKGALVDELSQTFITLRDFKRKEAIEVLSKLVAKAQGLAEGTRAAHEALQRNKALVCKKYATQNKVRQLRNGTLQRATADAELLKLEEFHKQVGAMAQQAKQQIMSEIGRFKEGKARQSAQLVQDFQQAQQTMAEQVHSTWQRSNSVHSILGNGIQALK